MLTKEDKKWVKETVDETVHEAIADLLVNHIQPTLATKADLKNFATKDDLKNFATKDDLKNFATKADLKNFATKAEMKTVVIKLDEIQNTMDSFLAEMKDMRQEQVVLSHKTYRDIAPKIDDHEIRIARLEKAI